MWRWRVHLACALVLLPCVIVLAWQIRSLAAPIVGEHDWRQADTYSVAYNFVHESADFFHPRIDWTRGRSGIMGMEAPVYPWIAALVMHVFGDAPSVARVVAWCFFALAIAFACRSLRPAGRSAFAVGWVVMLTMSPMAIFEARQIQPDGPMIALTLVAAAAFHESSRRSDRAWFAFGLASFTLAALIKTPALVAGPALWLLSFSARPSSWRVIALRTLAFATPILAAFAWHRWSAHLNATYAGGEAYFWTGFHWKDVVHDVQDAKKLRHVFFELLPMYVTSWVLFPAVIAGVVLGFTREHRAIAVPMLVWMACACLMNAAFSERLKSHWYYAMVMLPPVAYFGALAVGRTLELVTTREPLAPVNERWAVAFVLLAWSLVPLIGGPLRERHDVPGASGFPELRAWSGESGFFVLMLLEAAAVVACLLPTFRFARVAFVASAIVAALLALPRAAHDTIQVLEARAAWDDWDKARHRQTTLRAAVDAASTRADQIVVDGVSPYGLHRALRKGWVEEPDRLDRARVAELGRSGAKLLLHYAGSGKRPAALSEHSCLARADDWELHHIP